ncbi:GntR family transcriptional regulator [Paracoccus sp. (in: a-proteobacteria)]|uniref:GntR family transcriptional regulator n=1 Tax=Paracoccus sp. TaxID=267 RepID=UPI00396C65AF
MNTWQAIRAEVLGRIRSGEWAPGTMIPTEQTLAAEMGCARATVNRAMRELADSGIIQRRRKVGTRVSATAERRTTLRLPAIREEIEIMGAACTYIMTECSLRAPSPQAMRALQVDADHELLLVTSRYLADERPHCAETVWLNPRAIDLPDATLFAEEPPQEWLARTLPVAQVSVSVLAESADGTSAVDLDVEPGTSVLAIERVNSLNGLPVSFTRQFYAPRHRLVFDD